MVKRELYLYDYVDIPYDDVVATVEEHGDELFQSATDDARDRAHHVHANLVVDLGAFEVGREIVVDTGELERPEDTRATLPIRWHAEEHEGLFPSLTANLEIAMLAERAPLTQVTLVGAYEPPMGLLGAAGDRLWGHRIAEAALHGFLDTVVSRLRRATGQQHG